MSWCRPPLLLMLLLCSPLWADSAEAEEQQAKKPEPGVTTETFEGGRRLDAVLHGPLIGYALPRVASGRREIILLTHTSYPEVPEGDDEAADDRRGPCDDCAEQTAALYHLRYDTPQPKLILLRDDLPGDATSLDAMDVDGDGVEELLLYRPAEVYLLRELGARIGGSGPELLLSDPDIWQRAREPTLVRATAQLDEPWLQVPGIGRVRYYRPAPHFSGWSPVAEAELPVYAKYRTNFANGFRIHSSPPFLLARSAAGPIFATRAHPVGEQRLQVLLIRPAVGPEQSVVEECWARLPQPERVLHQFTLLLDGEPVLLVMSMPADKLSFFDEQLLRIFPLQRDRSRTGRPPRAAFKTRANIINDPRPTFTDVDGDGRQDLVLGYWKGFDADRVVLDVYLQDEDGSFPSSPKTTGLDVKQANPSILIYGRDLDGDQRADLMIVAEERLQIYRGSATSPKGKSIVEPLPAFSAPVGDDVGGGSRVFVLDFAGAQQFTFDDDPPPRPVDLDGDGRSEVLLVAGEGLVSLVLFDRGTPPPAE